MSAGIRGAQEITSLQNARIRELARLKEKSGLRRKSGLFLSEGVRVARDAPLSSIEEIFLESEEAEKLAGDALLREKLEKCPVTLVSRQVLEKLCDTKTPQGIVCLHRVPAWDEGVLFGENALLLVLEGIQDPGNLGTMVRTAEAAGAAAILCDEKTADLYQPKVVRSTMGALFRLPFLRTDDLPGTLEKLKKQGTRVFAAHLQGAEIYTEVSYEGSSAVLIGNEGNGLSEEITVLADERILIPMEGGIESLNAAVSAGIVLFEAARQRRQRKGAGQ